MGLLFFLTIASIFGGNFVISYGFISDNDVVPTDGRTMNSINFTARSSTLSCARRMVTTRFA